MTTKYDMTQEDSQQTSNIQPTPRPRTTSISEGLMVNVALNSRICCDWLPLGTRRASHLDADLANQQLLLAAVLHKAM